MFVNTVPDGGHAPRRLQRLPRPQRQPDPDLRPAHHAPEPERVGRHPRPLPRQHHPGQPARHGGPERRLDLPAAERPGQLRQLHLDRQPLGARPQLHRPHRPPRGRPRQLLRALQLREVQARRAPGTGRLLPAHAAPRRPAASTSARSWPASRTRASPPTAAPLNWTHLFGPNVVNELRVGYAKTNPETRQSDYGHQSATSLGIQGINVSEYTTGLPNLNIQDVTGHLRRPGLPARQPEADPLPGRGHALAGSRAGTRSRPATASSCASRTPFTHTNTRSSIAINRNLTNNPQTNSQGSGLATLLLGYTTGGSRGFLLDVYDFTNSEHSLFVQDDWKLSDRITVNARPALRGLRPRHRGGEPPAELRPRGPCSSSTRARTPTERANKETRWGNLAPRLGDRLGRDRRRQERAARRLRPQLLPGAPRGRQPARPERARLDLAELQRGDEPARLLAVARPAALEPVPAHRAA